MGLSSDLISQFVKVTKDDNKKNKETTSYGTIVEHDGTKYVRLDGSEVLTPITSTAETKPGERVTVTIKNHTAIVNGNISSPAARTDDVKEIDNKVTAHGNTIESINNNITEINNTVNSQNNTITEFGNKIDIQNNTITELGNTVNSQGNTITSINNTVNSQGNQISAINNDIEIYNSSFQIQNGVVTGIKGVDTEWISTESLEADHATISLLDNNYANINFANIGSAAIEKIYAGSGLIKNLIVGDQTISGELAGVTIRGDLIVGETIKADKLVVKGDDGLFYKLNVDLGGISPQEVPKEILGKNLHGSLIIAKSIDAEKITVKDLVAFGATIGGFNITDSSLYSGVKESVDNKSQGIYLDNQGQISIGGDSGNYLKYYKDQNGKYKLLISAESITFGTSGKDIETAINETITKSEEEFYKSTSPTSLSGGSWFPDQPAWEDGNYIWRRTKVTYRNGKVEYTPSENGICITGNTGAKGKDSIQLVIESSKGTAFKSDQVSTVLSVVIYKGSTRITDSTTMKSVFGNSSYLQWKYQNVNAESFSIISSSDSRLGDGGFTLTLSPTDVDTKVVFMCELIT